MPQLYHRLGLFRCRLKSGEQVHVEEGRGEDALSLGITGTYDGETVHNRLRLKGHNLDRRRRRLAHEEGFDSNLADSFYPR